LERFVAILSIDGGGIRGIIPALLVAEIEKRTGASAANLFQLIAGTSTGGILGLGLSRPDASGRPIFTAADLADFYRTKGEIIFPPRSFAQNVFSEFSGPKYPDRGIESILRERFGECELKDALTDVMVTTYDIEARRPYHFKSWMARQNQSYNFSMWQVARATSAAPTYFAPIKLHSLDFAKSHTFIDGGVFANNPAMSAVAEASRLHPVGLTRYVLVSLGTGVLTRPYHLQEAARWGQLEWVRPVLDITLQAAGSAVDYQVGELLGALKDPTRYFRFQGVLNEADDDLDNASPENVRRLEELAGEIIHENNAAIDELCGWLKLSMSAPAKLQDESVPPRETVHRS
jgi:uncharacterized protein